MKFQHVSRLLSAQMTSIGIGPGVREVREKGSQIPLPRVESDEDDDDKEDLKFSGGVDPLEERPKRGKDKVSQIKSCKSQLKVFLESTDSHFRIILKKINNCYFRRILESFISYLNHMSSVISKSV